MSAQQGVTAQPVPIFQASDGTVLPCPVPFTYVIEDAPGGMVMLAVALPTGTCVLYMHRDFANTMGTELASHGSALTAGVPTGLVVPK